MTLAERLQRDWWRPRGGGLRSPGDAVFGAGSSRPGASGPGSPGRQSPGPGSLGPGSLGLLPFLLLPLAGLYRLVSGARRAMYRRGWREARAIAVPVVVVGNLIVGGAGKTPTVIALVDALRSLGWTPGVVSRGYGRDDEAAAPAKEVGQASTPREVGDEPLLIRLRTRVPVMVGRDRAAAAKALCAAHPEVNVIVSDDGLQHLALDRKLQVLVFDERGAGNGLPLPAGPMRQPLPRTLPADTLVLYNAAAATTPLPGSTARRRLVGAASLADWLAGVEPDMTTLHALRERPVLAAAGLADPQRFFRMLEAEGLTIARLPLPDHHDFARLPWDASTADVVLTEKDAVKLGAGAAMAATLATPETRVWVVRLDLRLADEFIAEVARILGPARPSAHDPHTVPKPP